MQAPAHSVLFDSNDATTDGGVYDTGIYADLDFEPTSYGDGFGGSQQQQQQQQQQHDGQSEISGTVNEFYSGGYESSIPPLVERSWLAAFGTGGFSNEPPLLEELGINFGHIKNKTLAVLNPFRRIDKHIYDDTDMAGPLLFILLLGTFLLLSGKSQFGYIYGVALFGCISIYAILNFMSVSGIDVARTASILGYCLLPLVTLSGIGLLIDLRGFAGMAIAAFPILWCTYSAATMFVTVLSMSKQRLLVAYPILLFYSSFALMTIF